MKLIGSYTSPYVRKISVMLLEKGIAFDFVNDPPANAGSKVTQFNPLGKVPALVTDEGEVFFDSPIIVQFIELLNVSPTLLPWQPLEALRVRQIEALADGVTDAAVALVLESKRDADKRNEEWVIRQREKLLRGLHTLEQHAKNRTLLNGESLNVADIAVACCIGYLNFRRVAPGWCVEHPTLISLVERLFQRESFAQTTPA
ncbi:glutathione S-transferase [Ewingella americana]|jgi:glutathione S-transferase|uniref:Glutathione S-transferase n=1 Tax=Ewingella americana TaxID=41202 RepID=A0A502G7K9_9GAMM|nr:glutathione S-transferase [Ewingella americana]TPG57066.1 glutathione S-transferase [Ewingella americana]